MSSVLASPASRSDTLPVGIPDLTLGWAAIAWAQTYLRQPNGPRAGQLFRFTDRQKLFLLHWYALRPDGTWVYHHAIRRLAKGSGKSPFAAALALIELCAPVRFKCWDPDALGGVEGKPVAMPLVQIAAVSLQQTENTMRMVRQFAPKRSKVALAYDLDPGMTRYNLGDGGRLEVITSSAATAEGAEATAAIGDETEWWLGGAGAEFMNTIADNLAKSGSRMVETCNAWKPGVGSVAESSFDSWVHQEEQLLSGLGTKSGSLILYDARSAPASTDMSDYDSLMAGLEYVYEDCWWQQLTPIVTRIMHRSSRPDDSKRKYLNWPTAPDDAWVNPQAWANIAADGVDGRPSRELVDGEKVALFFDGSQSNDATALMGCCMSDGHVFCGGVWEPNPRDPDTRVDFTVVDNRVEALHERFEVVAFFADVAFWEGFVKVTWPERYKDRYQVWAVPGGKLPEPIAFDMRSRTHEFALAAELVEAEIREGMFTQDGHEVVARHIANARQYETRWGAVSVKKETPNSPDKIDAAVCVIGARMAYRLVQAGAKTDEPSEAFFAKRW